LVHHATKRRSASGHAIHARRTTKHGTGAFLYTILSALALALVLAFALPHTSLGFFGTHADQPTPTALPSATPEDTTDTGEPQVVQPTPSPDPITQLDIVAAGDILPHGAVLVSAKASGTYDFVSLMEPVAQFINGAGLALCHMEVPSAAPGGKPSGYPHFSAPAQMVPEIRRAGWDGCSSASNHSADQGRPGIVDTLNAFDAAGLGVSGTARSPETATPQFYEVKVDEKTVRIAHISVTNILNASAVKGFIPARWELNRSTPDEVIEQARLAREQGADLVLVSVHDGQEYSSQPTEAQKAYVQALADSGEIDATIGHHAHVPQPITKLAGGPQGDGMWAAYGLGNFLSNQDSDCCVAQTSNGLLYFLHVEVGPDLKAHITGASWRATTVDRLGGHRVLDLSALAQEHIGAGTLSAQDIETRYQQVRDVVGDEASELTDFVPSDATVTVVPRAGS